MEYSHNDHHGPEFIFPAADAIHQIPTGVPMDDSQAFHTTDAAAIGPAYGAYDETHFFQGYSMHNADEPIDTARGPRLTQEQLAHLEEEFARNFKPNTDHKKALADEMRVEYAKVNNWFQNRRAKAKHECQIQQRSSDQSLHEGAPAFGMASMDYTRVSDSHTPAYYSSPEQVPIMTDGLVPPIDFDCLNDVCPQYYAQTATASINQSFNTSATLQPDLSTAVISDSYHPWPTAHSLENNKMPAPVVREIDPLAIVSASPSVHSSCIDLGQGSLEWQHPPMYHNIMGGHLVGNPSSQSFGTSPSEDDEQAKLITPPQETSPLAGPGQGPLQHDRHASNSSDLAENLNTVHIQQSHVGQGLNTTRSNPSGPMAATSTGLPTPEISPDTINPRLPSGPSHDLAARRKRPRPAALQPESNRCASYTGPMTTSPSLRISPPAGKLSPVRRIKSTGQNLNVMTGRVKKTGNMTAQLSPRNLESCFKVATMSEPRANVDQPAHSRQTSGANGAGLTAPSPPTFPQRRQGTWPESPQVFLPSNSWDHCNNSNVPDHRSSPGPGWATNQPDHTITNLSIPPPQPHHFQQYSYHCPPQSAPSHVTTFDVGPLVSENIDAHWSVPSVHPEPYRDDTRLSMPIRPNHLQNHSHSGPFNYYQTSGPSFQNYASVGAYLPCPPPFPNRTPTPPQKLLDIKVETGPPPPESMRQTSQERKEYTFENSFPCDPHFINGSKK